MSLISGDIAFGLRVLSKQPVFTLIAVLTLGLGIGVNSAIFSLINPFLFRPLPVKNPDQLVVIGTKDEQVEFPYELSYRDYLDCRELKDTFSDLSAYIETTMSLSEGDRAERIWVGEVTANYFSMLNVNAIRGRVFASDEDRVPMANPIMVLGYNFWQRRFGGNESIIGKTVRINRHPVTIVGVAPENFSGTNTLLMLDAFVPFNQVWPGREAFINQRNERSFNVIGRLNPNTSLAQARATLDTLANRLQQDYPTTNKGIGFVVVPELKARPLLAISGFTSIASAIFTLLAALVLLISCSNAANLMLSRALSRQKEIAIRTALGASRRQIVQQLLVESLILSVLGGGVGLLLSLWATNELAAFKPSIDAPIDLNLGPDMRVFAFTLLIAVLSGLIAGLLPAMQASRINLNELLKEGGRSSVGGGRQRVRSLLVMAQVTVSFVLLICTGLFIRSLRNAERMDLGFRTDHLLLLSMDVGDQGYDEARGQRFYKELLDRVPAIPGIRSASLTRFIPLGYQNDLQDVFREDQVLAQNEERQSFFYNVVGRNYFETLGVPVVQGRDFTEQDNESAPKVAIINEAFASRLWPGQDPLDKRFKMGREGTYFKVVGVTKNATYIAMGADAEPFFYLPLSQNYRSTITLYVQTTGDPPSLLAPVQRAIQGIDPELPVFDVKTMASHIRDGRALLFVRLGAMLSMSFGLLGLILSAIGIYGVISHSVTQRTHEIGLRMALGATPYNVLKLVVGRGMILVSFGLAFGLGIALVITRLFSGLLYGVSAADPLTFAVIATVLWLVGLLACLIPASRAFRLDPMVALRSE